MLYTHAAAALIAAALAATGTWRYQEYRHAAIDADRAAAAQEARRNQERATRETETNRQQKVTHAQQQAADRASVARRDADSARAELERLRDDITTARADAVPGSACAASDRRAAAAAELLAECSAAYQGMARTADGHAGDVRTLMQAWPK